MSDHEVPAAVWVYTDDEEDREFVVVHDYNARVIVEATDGIGGRASMHLTSAQAINLARALLDTAVSCMVYENMQERMVQEGRKRRPVYKEDDAEYPPLLYKEADPELLRLLAEEEMETQQRQHEAEIERMYAPYGGESPF